MRPERIVAALLAGVAAGLVTLLIFGPTEGAKAKGDKLRAATPAPTTTAPTTIASTTTEPEPEETVESEQEPVTTEAEPPSFRPGDWTSQGRSRSVFTTSQRWTGKRTSSRNRSGSSVCKRG